MSALPETNVIEMTKRCTKCGVEKPLSGFHSDYHNKNIKQSQCKDCRRAYQAAWRNKNASKTPSEKEQRCCNCGETKPAGEFRRWNGSTSGLTSSCKLCIRKRDRARYPKKRMQMGDWQRWYYLKKAFGLTREDFERLLTAQNNCCAICARLFSEEREPCVDHDHKTSAVRGLLCRNCNFALGLLGDCAEAFESAANYLRKAI